MQWMRRLNIEIIFALVAGSVAVVINNVYYQNGITLARAADWMIRYFSFGNPYFIWFFAFIYLLFLWKFYIKCTHLAHAYINHRTKPSHTDGKELLSYLVEPLYLLAPLAIITGPFFTLLGNISYELRFTRMDEWFARADFFIWGTYPFLALPQFIRQDWIVALLKDFYMSLALVMSATLGITYLQDKKFFRTAVIAFLFSLVVTYPFFYMFPCQDPGNYFVRNLRSYPLPSHIDPYLAAYQPTPLAKQIITRIEESETTKSRDNQVPVSCFPSMHAVWSYFIIYFLARITLWSLIITIPWAVIVLTGGMYFAQHYFIDYVIAIPLAVVSIVCAIWLLRLESLWKKPNI